LAGPSRSSRACCPSLEPPRVADVCAARSPSPTSPPGHENHTGRTNRSEKVGTRSRHFVGNGPPLCHGPRRLRRGLITPGWHRMPSWRQGLSLGTPALLILDSFASFCSLNLAHRLLMINTGTRAAAPREGGMARTQRGLKNALPAEAGSSAVPRPWRARQRGPQRGRERVESESDGKLVAPDGARHRRSGGARWACSSSGNGWADTPTRARAQKGAVAGDDLLERLAHATSIRRSRPSLSKPTSGSRALL